MRASRRSSRRGAGALAVACAALIALALAPGAVADIVVCGAGEAEADCPTPRAVAVDREASILYVAHGTRIDAFDAEELEAPGGGFLDSFDAGMQITGIAVDNGPASTDEGDLYAYDDDEDQVLKLRPTGGGGLELISAFSEGSFASQAKLDVGPEGVVYVADSVALGGNVFERRVHSFDHTGTPIETIVLATELGFTTGFAVDSADNCYVGSNFGTGAVRRYGGCEAVAPLTFHRSFNIQTIATDTEDNLFVSDNSGPVAVQSAVYQYDSSATIIRVFYGDGPPPNRLVSLAPFESATGDVFAAEATPFSGPSGNVLHLAFPPPGPVVHPDPGLTEADPIGNTSATLRARVNPEGKASTYRFQYVTEAAYQEDIEEGGDGFAEATETPETPVPPGEPAIKGLDPLYALVPVTAEVGCEDPPQPSCLEPETKYRLRAIATNADGEDVGPVGSFETKPPFEILATFASSVGTDAAKLHAEANPLNIPLTGRFEYVTEAQFEASGFTEAVTTEEVDFGSGEDAVVGSVQLHSLQPDTTYLYRVVLENFFATEAGEAHAFSTFSLPGPRPSCPNDALRVGPARNLPDCRAYEMVSPVDKEGGEIVTAGGPITGLPTELNQGPTTVPSSGLGLTYSSYRAFGDVDSTPFSSQYLATRRPLTHPEAGWSSIGISPPREGPPFQASNGPSLDTQFKVFDEDLSRALLRTDSEPPLDEAAVPGYSNIYRYESAVDDFQSVCPVFPPSEPKASQYLPEPQGFGRDGGMTVFRANDALSERADPVAGDFQLYACEEGESQPAVVSILPPSLGGKAGDRDAAAGTGLNAAGDHRRLSLHNAISANGERIYWTESGPADSSGPGRIYLRERPFAAGAECAGEATPCTLAVSESVGGVGSEENAVFWTASPDGSRAIFSFTAGSLAGSLYVFDAETGKASLIAAGTSGLAGWSEDAETLYLVSTKEQEGKGEEGESNLFRYQAGEGGGFRLIAALPGGSSAGGLCAVDQADPVRRCTRVTPDGGQLAFVSRDRLSDYDNRDVGTGEKAAEVYLYDAEVKGGEGELICASCNPSGGRPRTRDLGTPSIPARVAAQIPTWENAFHASRVLSSDGRRLFFESFDSLVPGDSNGTTDVYEWQRAGKGTCDASDPDHFASNGGCLALISSGQDPQGSEIVDASADGRDLFFKTSETLYSSDPGLVDVYDARVGGGFPAPDPPEPPCEGEACQSPPPAPDPPDPATETLRGPGNVPPPASNCRTSARKAKRLATRAKRARRTARLLARASRAPRRVRRLRRVARRSARTAKRRSRAAKRCRARARRQRR